MRQVRLNQDKLTLLFIVRLVDVIESSQVSVDISRLGGGYVDGSYFDGFHFREVKLEEKEAQEEGSKEPKLKL